MHDKICEYLSPIDLPKKPEIKEPIKGKNISAYSIINPLMN